MTPILSQPLVPALFPSDRPNSTLYHPQLDESLYKTWELIILGILAGCVCLVTICGNLTVLMSFFLERSIRQPSNYFIASLAVSDLLIGTISMPLYTTYILTWKNWPLGEILCDLWLSIDYTACLCSIYTIFCITIDRFCSIRLPTKYRVWRTERKVLFVVFLTWAIPILLFFTSIFGWQHFVGHRSVPSGKCYVQYMDEAFFNCFLQVGYFWTTLVAMFVLYAGIYRVALDLHRRSDDKRRRHLNSLATMAGCTIGQLGTVIGMSHGPRRVGGVVQGAVVGKEVRTISETVNVTSGYSSHRGMLVVDAGGGGCSPVEPDDCGPVQDVRIDLERVGIRSGVPSLTGFRSMEPASAGCISKEMLSESSVQHHQSRSAVESITPLRTFTTRKRHLLGKHRRNSELGLSAAAFFKAVEHIQEYLLLSAGQQPARGNLDLPRSRDIEVEVNVSCSGYAIVNSDSFTLSKNDHKSCNEMETAIRDELQEISSVTNNDSDFEAMNGRSSHVIGCDNERKRDRPTLKTRSFSLCCNSPTRLLVNRHGRRFSQLQGKRLATLIPSYSEIVNNKLTGGVNSDPELVTFTKCTNLTGNDDNRTTIMQRKPFSNLIPLEVCHERFANPQFAISPNSVHLIRNDAELVETVDYNNSRHLEQPMGQIPEGEFRDEFDNWTRFESDAQCGPPRSITRDRKPLILRKYRTEGHLEWCSNQAPRTRATHTFAGHQDTLLTHARFRDGEDPTNDNLTLCGETGEDDPWERNLGAGTGTAPPPNEDIVAENIWERNIGLSPPLKWESQVQRETVSTIPGLDPDKNPARSAARPKRRAREDSRPVDEIFHTQTSSEHPVSDLNITSPDNTVVDDTPAIPIHTFLLTSVSPEIATSATTSLTMGDDVNDDVNEDVINNSRNEKKQLDYLRVPDLVTPIIASPSKPTQGRSGNEIHEYDQGFEDRFPPGLKRLIQGSRRGHEGGDPHRRPSEKHLKNENRARKALRTITIILGAFVLCWTPWHVLSLIIGFCSTSVVCVSPVLYDISYWLCYLNSPINPFCYAFVNQQFKKTFVRVLRLRWHRT